jgi:hypothetical protein
VDELDRVLGQRSSIRRIECEDNGYFFGARNTQSKGEDHGYPYLGRVELSRER